MAIIAQVSDEAPGPLGFFFNFSTRRKTCESIDFNVTYLHCHRLCYQISYGYCLYDYITKTNWAMSILDVRCIELLLLLSFN